MKEIYQIFDETFNAIQKHIEVYKFDSCTNLSSELIRIASMSDYSDGIFVCEILETIFSNISQLFGSYEISENDRKLIKDQLKEKMNLLTISYRGEDKAKMYNIMKDMRSTATQFQFKCWNTMKEIPEPDVKRYMRR